MNCPTLYECPEGSACVSLGQGTTLCLDQCSSNDSCRDGYGCKVFSSVEGQSIQGCYALNSKLSVAGGACKEHTDCPGAASCLSVVDEGYCAVINCGADAPCLDSTACVIFNGVPSCLKSCKNTEECMVEGAVKRFCEELLNTQSKPSKVCVPSVPGVGVGQSCASNIECESAHCRIVATGKCVGLELGCLSNSDCPSSIVCEQAPAYFKGVCSQLCASNLTCSGNSLCIDTGGEEKWCHLPCLGASDAGNCDPVLGESCVFGDPLANTTGSGKYACVVFKPGDDGYACEADIDCKKQHCLGNPGICTSFCADTLSCAFPTTCLAYQGELRCMRRCFSVLDCPSNLKCTTTPTSPNKICIP
ncbi:MAG TPA: hypothetical protein EYN66_22325 [Myxococcales bacterium]|nr:hypothetical protein [Myxococcales bacterium]